MDLGIEVINERRVALRFDTFPRAAYQNLFEAISRATERLADMAQAAAPKKTGRLASEIHGRVQQYETRITGIVEVSGGTANDYAKAAAEEYGAHGLAHVRAHQARLTHVFARADSMQVMKEAYDRRVNIRAREFLRAPLHSIEGDVVEQMRAAVEAAGEE